MKNKIYKNKKYFSISIFVGCAIVLILFGCVYIDSVSIMQTQSDGTQAPVAKAGTYATFTVNGNINCAENHGDVQFVVSFLAPKSWNVREHAKVTYVTTLHTDPDEILSMSLIPESSLPKNAGGRTWGEALMQDYGVGPNVLSDMEWVTFQTDKVWAIYNGDKPTYTIYIQTNVGELNLKTYLGFFVNHTDDGISSSTDHKKVQYSDVPFEVIEGKGLTIDYSNNHFNKAQPLAALQDDFITFSFNGGAYVNDLVNYDEIYVEMKAYSTTGSIIAEIAEKTAKTLLTRESSYSQTFNLLIWPVEFFNVPDGTVIDRIEYVFTNKTGTVIITQSDDDYAVEGIEIPEKKEPFVFELLCD